MRIIGYAMVIIGFAWLFLDNFAVHARARTIAYRHAKLLPDRATFTPQEMVESVYEALDDLAGRWPWLWLPGLLMLAGGVVLNRAGRSRTISNRGGCQAGRADSNSAKLS